MVDSLQLSAADQAATAPGEMPKIVVLGILSEPASGGAGMEPQPDYFISVNEPPDPDEIRGFCYCAIEVSGGGCIRLARHRAPRRSRGTHSAGSRIDDGGGGDDGDGPPLTGPREPSSEWRAA